MPEESEWKKTASTDSMAVHGNDDTEMNKDDPVYTIHPFSALVPSLKPSIAYESDDQLDPQSDRPDFDEFGFRLDNSAPVNLFTESIINRRSWLTCMEFSYTHTLGVSQMDEGQTFNSKSAALVVGSTIDEDADELWSRVHLKLIPSPRLTSLVHGDTESIVSGSGPVDQLGVPHTLRPHVWPRLSGSLEKAKKSALRVPPITYTELVQFDADIPSPGAGEANKMEESWPTVRNQIEKDLLRTIPQNLCFSSPRSTGISRLRRILRALAWLYVDVGYCQGMGLIAANLLLCLEEEAAFWMMCSIVEDLLPSSYYSSTSLLGVKADQAVLGHLVSLCLPRLDRLLQEHEIELPLVTLQWFLTLYSSVCPTAVTYRIWDLLFYEGSVVLFRIALAFFTIKEPELLACTDSNQVFTLLSALPTIVADVRRLIKVAYSLEEEHLDSSNIASLRRHYLSQLIVEQSGILQPGGKVGLHLPKQYLTKRQLKRPRNLLDSLFQSVTRQTVHHRLAGMRTSLSKPPPASTGRLLVAEQSSPATGCQQNGRVTVGSTSPSDWIAKEDVDPRLKNIRQTEILVELKHAILLVARHFRKNDPQHADTSSQADYSLESHGLDLETYVQIAQRRRRRAKALVDFERHEADELGFQRNEIITVLQSDDEHCWVGESADGTQRGWFPANFVELLDERGKNYSPAGDDAVDPVIADLIRGVLCSSLGAVFTHGLKRPKLVGDSKCHPWKFIEEAVLKEVERDFSSIYSRLTLCKSFRLDEEGKVLSPEEVLYRAIQSVNMSHDAVNAHPDIKFRSLICCGLNEQLLHMWLETLCSCVKVVRKWYYPWSYLRSPGWVQIKCELRVLSQFAFHLSPVYELTDRQGSPTTATGDREAMTSGGTARNLSASPSTPVSKVWRSAAAGRRPSAVDSVAGGADTAATALTPEAASDMLVKYHLFSWEL